MGPGLISFVAAVIVGGAFGSATANVESIDSAVMVLEIEVEVLESADSVVAHLTFEEEELVLPLLDRGDGIFGIRTELAVKNYSVVFETVGEGGESSGPTTLSRMGADLGPEEVVATASADDDEGLSDESQGLLWLAIALGAGSLSLVAFWVLGGRDEDRDEPDEESPGEGEVAEEE